MEPVRRALPAVLALLALAAPASAILVPLLPEGPCADVAGTPLAGQLACGRWDPMGPLPAPREGLGLVFARSGGPVPGLLLAFGGFGPDGAVHGDLWGSHAGSPTWHAFAPGPSRADAVLVLDDTTQRAYLFGGRDATGPRDDLWVYDTTTDAWTALATPPGPSARYGAAGAWDPATRTLWIFGGTDGTAFDGELWSYEAEANTWTLGPNAPQARSFASAVWDPVRRALQVHGGADDTGELPDHWIYRPASGWSPQVSSGDPVARAAAAWWPQRTNLVEFGGLTRGAPTDRTALYGAEGDIGLPFTMPPVGVWLAQAPVPGARAGAAAAWEFGIGVAVLAGGRTAQGITDEAWVWTPSTEGNAL